MTNKPGAGASGTPRFDVNAVRAKAGDEVFERGEEYVGSVEIIAVDAQRVVARVVGSEAYRAVLTGAGQEFSGSCSCPAYTDWGFCKHLVATALVANADGGIALTESEDLVARIRAHLRARGLEALIERIIALSERDPALREALALEASVDATDDDDVFARFEKAIAAATQAGDYIPYEEAADWGESIASVLDSIEVLIDAGRAALALRLLDHLLERIDEALETVDDSDGEAEGLIERAYAMHHRACVVAKPDPVVLARALFALGLGSDTFAFTDAGVSYGDVLGAEGGAEYRRLVRAAWDELEPAREGQRIEDRGDARRYRLTAMLDDLAEHDGDLDTRISIRVKSLSTPDRYVDLARLCFDHGRTAEAARWIEEGLKHFAGRRAAELVSFAADLYRGLGRGEEAEALLWRQFERDPNRSCYDQLRAGAGTDAGAAAIVDRAEACLEARLAADKTPRPPAGWMTTADADLLVDILVSERRVDAAWQAALKHRCNDWTMRALAGASEDSHPVQALEFYAKLVEQAVGLVAKSGYERACELIRRMGAIRYRVGEGAAHAAYVADLSMRHKAKRSFMQMLLAQNLAALTGS